MIKTSKTASFLLCILIGLCLMSCHKDTFDVPYTVGFTKFEASTTEIYSRDTRTVVLYLIQQKGRSEFVHIINGVKSYAAADSLMTDFMKTYTSNLKKEDLEGQLSPGTTFRYEAYRIDNQAAQTIIPNGFYY